MKIAFIVGSFPQLSESFIVQQIVGLINNGHDVCIFAETNPRYPGIIPGMAGREPWYRLFEAEVKSAAYWCGLFFCCVCLISPRESERGCHDNCSGGFFCFSVKGMKWEYSGFIGETSRLKWRPCRACFIRQDTPQISAAAALYKTAKCRHMIIAISFFPTFQTKPSSPIN